MKQLLKKRFPTKQRKQIIWFLLLLFIASLKTACGQDYGTIAGEWRIRFGFETNLTQLFLATNVIESVPLTIYDIERNAEQSIDLYFQIEIGNSQLASVEKRIRLADFEGSTWQGEVKLKGLYFGYTEVYLTLNDLQNNRRERSRQSLDVIVVRAKRLDDKILTYTAAAIMLLMFVNLGTVLDLKRLVSIFTRPIGPLLGFCSRYLIMPGLALGLGGLVFKENKRLRLALLFTALAPGGGIANICNVFLKGNIHLSVATTTVNSVLALGIIPFWIYLLGPFLYKDATLGVPFVDLAVGCVGLLLALLLGAGLRFFIPKTTRFIFRFLKPLSIFLSLCLLGVIVGINYFIFKEITFLIFLVSLFLPAIGFVLSFGLSKLLCRSATDAMTIALETGVLNMTLPIVFLQYTFAQPMADMLIVIPITAALTSLCLVLILYIVRRIFGWNTKKSLDAFDDESNLSVEKNSTTVSFSKSYDQNINV